MHGLEDGNNGNPIGLNELVEILGDGKRQNVRQAYDLDGVRYC